MAKSSAIKGPTAIFSSRNLIIAGAVWAIAALLFFIFFSVSPSGEPRPLWYSIGTSVFEYVAFSGAAIVCFRNWRSKQILSGRSVWLAIGAGMLCYFIGGLFFSYWELGLQKEPDVSPGDVFYVATYVFLSVGMLLAVLPRRLNLEIWQWAAVGVIGVVGAVFSFSPLIAGGGGEEGAVEAAVEATAEAATTAVSTAPAWAVQAEELLNPFADIILNLYTVGDIVLLVLASALLLAFWGGRSAQSWRMIAAAAISLYIADMWFNYAINNIANYESGSLLEGFWIFSGGLFGIGAVLEFDLSTRSRRSSRRRSSSASSAVS
ncbi:MAG: hypothetical protein ACFCBU_05245 [Cyanophyceae cyanobacterium]